MTEYSHSEEKVSNTSSAATDRVSLEEAEKALRAKAAATTNPAYSRRLSKFVRLTRSAEDDYILRVVLALADEHRMNCPGASCTITLTSLVVLLQRAGIHLTPEEYGRLL